MKKNDKKYVLEELKKELEIAVLIATSAVTGLTVVGCGSNKKKEDTVINNYIVSEEKHTDVTTPVTTIETTMTTLRPINLDPTKRKYVGGKKTADSENVDASYENDLAISTTITSVMDSNMNNIDDNNTRIKNNTKINPTTTKITNKAAIKPITSKTTTISESTTEAVTESPVTEPVQRDHVRSIMGYNIEQIAYDSQALSFYSSIFNSNMLSNLGYDTMYTFDIGYGQTSFGREFIIFMIAMNPEIQDDCINANINYFDPNDFENYKTFLYNFKHVQEIMGSDIDFANYTIDIATGEFLNNAFSAEKNGTFDQFMSNTIASGNVSPNVLNNAGAMAVLYSCDGGRYLNYNDIDNNLNENFNRIRNAAFGPDYIK